MKKLKKLKPQILYFDYAATAPMNHSAKEGMNFAINNVFGNPSSLHREGASAISLLDKSREIISNALGGEFNGVIFTASATEANNLLLKGIAKTYIKKAKKENLALPARIIISASEHDSINETADKLSEEGLEIIRLPMQKNGAVNLKLLEESLNDRTIIVSLIYVNNETGAINNVSKASKIISKYKQERLYPIFHTDASQAVQYEECGFKFTGASAITISSHKIGGPKGVGVLVFEKASNMKLIEPQIYGGGQEFGMRSGTENVPAIYGFALSLKQVFSIRKKESVRLKELKKILAKMIVDIMPSVKINGPTLESGAPHILNLWLPKISAETFVINMDMEGVALSYGSACLSRANKPSRAISALGYDSARTKESIRISIGRETRKEDIYKFAKIFKKVITNLHQ